MHAILLANTRPGDNERGKSFASLVSYPTFAAIILAIYKALLNLYGYLYVLFLCVSIDWIHHISSFLTLSSLPLGSPCLTWDFFSSNCLWEKMVNFWQDILCIAASVLPLSFNSPKRWRRVQWTSPKTAATVAAVDAGCKRWGWQKKSDVYWSKMWESNSRN